MKRSKHIRIRRIALGLAVAAVIPATAQARPLETSGSAARAIHQSSSRGVEIPYLSHGVGVSAGDFDQALGPDDRSFSRQSETPTVASAHGGSSSTTDLSNTNTVGGLLLILAALGTAVAIRHNRKAKLSPA
jgi:hypothetical protein